MADFENGGDIQLIDRPLLFFKVGVLGCTPLDMPKRLAEEYDAQYLSSDLIRKGLIEARDAQGMPKDQAQDIDVKRIKSVLSAQATPILSAREDVVADMFFNTVNSRRFPLSLASKAGALTAALWVNTSFETALERVQQWTDSDSFDIPVSRWGISPVLAAKSMMNHVEWPDHEGIDYVFNLDGSGDTDDILRQFDEKLELYGLAERYESIAEE